MHAQLEIIETTRFLRSSAVVPTDKTGGLQRRTSCPDRRNCGWFDGRWSHPWTQDKKSTEVSCHVFILSIQAIVAIRSSTAATSARMLGQGDSTITPEVDLVTPEPSKLDQM